MLDNYLNRIILGDAIEVLSKIPDNSIHLIITSPPYNLNKPYSNHNDLMDYENYLEWMGNVWAQAKRVLIKGGRLCINIGENKRQNITYPTYSAFIQQCVNLKMLYRGTIIWNKHSAAKHCAWGSWNSCSNPHIVPRHEYILIFSKDQWKLEGSQKNCDLNREEFMTYTRSIWVFAPESRNKIGHPAPFPEELPYRLIKFYSYRGNIVLDMFSGSGTVGIVARKLGRNFVLIDNSLEYCKLASQRFAKETCSLFDRKNIKQVKIVTPDGLETKTKESIPVGVAEKRVKYSAARKAVIVSSGDKGGIKGTLPFNYMMTCKADKSRLCRNGKRPHYPCSRLDSCFRRNDDGGRKEDFMPAVVF
jgi:site-specific DNA-methyltransferase (adenine-specific)